MLLPGEEVTEDMLKRLSDTVNAEENPVKYLSIDPGKANGICGYDAKYYTVFMLTLDEKDVVDFLQQFKFVDTCIIENFILYPNKAQQQVYSDMGTSRVIGRVESWANKLGVDLVKQNASIKSTGYAWIGQKPLPKSNKKNHEMDAHVHFIYWAVKSHRMDAAQLIKPRKGL